MEKDRSKNRIISDSSPVTSQQQSRKESNGYTTTPALNLKRKKTREKKSNYLQDWLDKSHHHDFLENDPSEIIDNYGYNFMTQIPTNNQAPGNRNVSNAFSEPNIWRNNFPINPLQVGFSYEQVPVPLCSFPNQPMCRPPQPNLQMFNKNAMPFQYRQNKPIRSSEVYNCRPNNFPPQENPEFQFTSLPPVELSNTISDDSSNQRRFSDPGIAQEGYVQASDSDESNKSTTDEEIPLPYKKIIMALVKKVNSLHKELRETRGEVEMLKQHSMSCTRRDSVNGSNLTSMSPLPGHSSSCYTPGMVCDVVREVRDATKIRDEAVMARLRSMLDDRQFSNSLTVNGIHNFNNGSDYMERSTKDLVDVVAQVTQTLSEKSQTNERLEKIMESVRNMQTSIDTIYVSPGVKPAEKTETFVLDIAKEREQEKEREREMVLLRRDLQEALNGRKDAEASSLK